MFERLFRGTAVAAVGAGLLSGCIHKQPAIPKPVLTADRCTPPQPFSADPSVKEWTTSSKPGDGSVFMFRGNRIGDRIDRLFPCYTSYEGDFHSFDANNCDGSPAPIRNDGVVYGLIRTCHELSSYNITTGIHGRAGIFLGDVYAYALSYHYLDWKLASFDMTMPWQSWPKMHDLLEAKYGKPIAKQEQIQNAAGAVFNDAITELWNTPDGTLRLRFRFPSTDAAMLDFYNPAFEKAKHEADEKAVREKAKNVL